MANTNPLKYFTPNKVLSPICRQGKDIMDAINDSEQGFITYESDLIHPENTTILRKNGFSILSLTVNDVASIGISWSKEGDDALYNMVINDLPKVVSQYDRKIGRTGAKGDDGLRGATGETGATGSVPEVQNKII